MFYNLVIEAMPYSAGLAGLPTRLTNVIYMKKLKNVFVFYFWFVSWKSISFGISLNLNPFHLEIHIPMGFIKIGMDTPPCKTINYDEIKWRGFGFNY